MMKRLFKFVIAFVGLILTADSHAQNFTNKGKEFWVGYGHHQSMETSCDGATQGANDQDMVLYLSNTEVTTAHVTVTLDGSGRAFPPLPAWSKTYTILPNQVIQSDVIPKGSIDYTSGPSDPNYDARLFSNFGGEELFAKRGIHIVSDVPIVAYAHIYAVTNSGATMLLPVDTWGYSYTSINSQQGGGVSGCFSWMYVIAKDNNTRVRIIPSATSRLGKPAGVPFTIDMQKGEIYQLIGQADCQTGLGVELTGTTVKSIVGADGVCHAVGVFSGSGRTSGESSFCSAGSRDNDMQQCFPEVAWGKRYLTTPFSSGSGSTLHANQLQNSVYKVVVKDPATVVKKNGVLMTGLINGKYYRYESTTADYIEANKPITVAQYMLGGGCGTGDGDPEMIYISPIEQAINNIGFFRNLKVGINTNYLTLVVPTTGLPSLRINNSQIFDYTYSHPQNALAGTNYTVVVKGWTAAQSQVIVKCDSAFNAITYGLGSAESYGYNAGTYLKNLNAQGELYNTPDTANKPRPFTCTGTPIQLTALIAYQPTSINWKMSALSAVMSPSTDTLQSNPTPVSTVIIGSATYYRYSIPGTYTFNAAGTYDLPFVCTSTDIDNCSLQETLQVTIEVKSKPSPDFTFVHSGCRTDSVSFFGPTATGSLAANQWKWAFGDNTVDSIKNPRKGYTNTGTYQVKLTVISAEGCLSDTTKPITIANARVASIFTSVPTGCEGTSITFSDTTTVTSGNFYWNFGIGAPLNLTSNTPQTITYPTAGTYTIKHVIQPAGSCLSDTVYKTITIVAKPAKPVTVTPLMFCQNTIATPLTATALTGNTLTWYNNTALTGGSTVAPTPSTVTAGTQYYYVTQTSSTGCISDTARLQVDITPVIATNAIGAAQTICSGSPAATLTGAAATGGTGSYSYQWQQSTDGGITWTDIAGATSLTYNPGILSTGITRFRRVATSGLCNAISNVVDITVQTNLSNYDISASQTICEGTAPALLDGQTPSGGTGSYTFQWQGSTDGVTWTVILGATSEDYQPGVITAKAYFRRVTTGGNCPAISSVVVITINPTPNGAITGPSSICQYNNASVNFTASAGTAPYTIQLLVTAPGGGTSTITQTVATNGPVSIPVIPINSTPGIYTIRLQSVSDNGSCVRTTGLNTITINVKTTPVITFSFTPVAPPICKGTSVGISANGATSYTWSPAAGLNTTTGTSVIATPDTTTTYTVTGTTNGCNGTGTITVTVNPIPAKPAVIRLVTYCQNAVAVPLIATALTGHSLTWYNTYPLTGGTAAAPTPATNVAGSFAYYVTQTSSGSFCASDTSTIIVTVTPVIANNNISADQTVCSGSPATTITDGGTPTGGTGSYTFQWQASTDGGVTWTNITGATSATFNPGILSAGITKFRRLITSGLCNSISNIVSIDVQTNLTNYDISASQTVCEGIVPGLLDGQTPTGGTGTFTYVWQSSPDGTIWTPVTGAIAEDFQPTVLSSNTYFRRITSGGNCPAISSAVLITVNPKPTGTIIGAASICSYNNAAVTFTATAGTAPFNIQLLITAPGGSTSTINQTVTSNGPVSINVLPINSTAGTYTVQLVSLTDSKGCSRTTGLASVSITVTAKPSLIVSAAAVICEGTSTNLTASGATTYTWSPATGLSAISGSIITANPITNTTYQVIGTTNGCSDTATIAISVTPRPAKPVVTRPVDYCLNTAASPLIATGSVGNTIKWYTNTALTGGTATAPTPSTATAGTIMYYVTQTNSTGCVSDTSIITVTVHPLPVADYNLPAGICMPNGVAAFKNKSTIADNTTLNYNWNFGDASITSTVTDATHIYAASGSYNVTLTATSAFGCINTKTQTLNSFYNKPVADFVVNPSLLCQGQDNFFTDNSNPSGSTITKWDWNFGDAKMASVKSPSHRYSNPGTYTVNLVVTTAIGCVSDTFKQDVVVYLQPRIDAGPSFVVPIGTTVQFKATANDTTISFIWSPATGLSSATILQPTVTVQQNQVYTLTATGQNNCTATDTLSVRLLKVIEVPNVFSPNGDGINDTWMIANLSDYPGAKVEIYNRWGQQVFLSYGYSRPWDGSMLGKPLPLATYYYIITLKNGFAPVTGSITIIK